MTRTHLTAQLARVGKPPPIPDAERIGSPERERLLMATADRLHRAGVIESADLWSSSRWSEAERRCGPKRRHMA